MELYSLLLTVLSIVSLITGQFVYKASAQLVACQESDRQALIYFKKGLEDSENRLLSWKGSNCCQWWGITCDNSSGAVIAVDLHNPHPSNFDFSGRYGFWNLSGEIRPSLTKLKSLRYLDLSFNTFNGTIPAFFSSLKNLQYLNLSTSGFTGQIPSTLGNLSGLQVLDLTSGFPRLTSDNLEWVSGLVSIKYLEMSATNLTMVGVGWIESLNKLSGLTELHLSGCGLSSPISSLTVSNFTSLAVIDLSGNNLNSIIPDWLANISSLVSVDFYYSGLYGRIPLGFSELPKLQALVLDDNDNLSASCSQLFRGSWKNIQVLDFSSNKLHGRLPASLGNMTSLTYLNLLRNHITGSVPSSISKLCDLRYLDLSANNLTGSLPEFLEEPANCLSKSPLPNLKKFAASDNKLVGNLPNWLGQLNNLVDLNFQYNFLEGPIPSSLGNLKNLTELRLEANKLNGTLPESIGKLSELFALDISINQMTGPISEAHFSRLSKLQVLVLSANSFTFNVSSTWIPPFQIWYLELGSCRVGPSFPAWIRSQKEIKYLDVSNTSLSGIIPNWFWDMSGNLSLLNVSFNHLQGHLPNPLNIAPSALLNMQYNLFTGPIPLPSSGVKLLDLSNNKFSGLIPENLSEISPDLVFLSLSNNQLVGSIIASVEELLSLEVIDLSRNNLTGKIPPGMGNCSSLKALDLQHNDLFGEIPESFGQLSMLQSLHLSNNKLSGEIPSSLRNLTSLETLDLGDNTLTGNIPQWIGNELTELRILRLRSNSFYGEIPPSLSNLGSLQVLDLAENKLNGTIPASFGDLKAMSRRQSVNHYLFYGSYMTVYYQENIVVSKDNLLQTFTKTLSLLNSVDLSRNNLQGKIPEEVTKMVGLEVLNLSNNHISGQISQGISQLQELLSLDLSGNKISGPVPSSMSSLSFLGYLNLSNNNLSGRIPETPKMTNFEASSFSGNPGLCGAPLVVKCPGDDADNTGTSSGLPSTDSDNDLIDKWFHISIGLGFATGLLLPYLVFAIRRSWSDAYFAAVDKFAATLWVNVQKRKFLTTLLGR